MPKQGKHGLWGWKPQLPDARDHLHLIALPDLIDYPTVQDLRPYCPPVWDQGQLGSCTAHAACGAFAYDVMRQSNAQFTPSRLFEYYNARLISGDAEQDGGSTCRDANKALAQYGVCDESLWPYDESQVLVAPTQADYTAALPHAISQYAAVPQDLLDMKATLFESMRPIQIGFTVYDSFESDTVASTGVVPMPDLSTESVLGGHAVLIVGYADTWVLSDNTVISDVFIVRNSWGSSWGDQGYMYVPYAYFTDPDLAGDLWVIESVPMV